MDNTSRVIIIGAGASGLMCALTAARRGKSVTVLDHSSKPARKVLASGGGRCNFTNLNAESAKYLGDNIHFTRSALARFSPYDFISMLDAHAIAYEEREEGKMFLTGNASQIAQMLTDDCHRAGVKIELGIRINSIEKPDKKFMINTSRGEFRSRNLIIATGGKSYDKLGASSLGYEIAQKFSHTVTKLRPALVPFTLKGNTPFKGLSGLSFRATVSTGGHEFTGDVLVTHHGLSGLVILNASSFWRDGNTVNINLLPDINIMQWLNSRHADNITIKELLTAKLPRRLAAQLADALIKGITGSTPMNSISLKQLNAIAQRLESFEIIPADTAGFSAAEVTSGGVDTAKISSKTMESSLVEGLYFIGEVLDVTGELGGYNLHWAWASGYAAAQSL